MKVISYKPNAINEQLFWLFSTKVLVLRDYVHAYINISGASPLAK